LEATEELASKVSKRITQRPVEKRARTQGRKFVALERKSHLFLKKPRKGWGTLKFICSIPLDRKPKNNLLAAGDGPDDHEGLGAGGDFGGERSVGRLEGIIFGASEEAEEWAALQGDVVADGAAEHRVAGFEGVEDGTLGDRAEDFELDLGAAVGQGAEMSG